MTNQEPAEDQPQGEAGTPQHTGVSPVMVIFLLSGIMGLIAAGAMLLGERQDSADDAPTSEAAAAVATPVSSRPLGDWEAENFQFSSLDGNLISLNQYRGQTVFLNLWWTGCGPCQREFPAFEQFMAEQGDDGAVVLAVNQGENAGTIRDFLDSVGVSSVPVLLDPDLTIREKYPYNFFPTTYVIGPEGQVRFRKIGEITIDDLYNYLDEVRQAS